MEGNSRADQLASQGVQATGRWKFDFMKAAGRRWDRYAAFVEDLHDMFLAVMECSFKLKQSRPFALQNAPLQQRQPGVQLRGPPHEAPHAGPLR
eukprot:14336703-Alexandrium_andersonii.AAC.1